MNGQGPEGLGRLLIVTGVVLALVGLGLVFGGKLGLGHLPGDIIIRRGSTTFYFPLVTMLLLSLVLSLVLGLFRRL